MEIELRDRNRKKRRKRRIEGNKWGRALQKFHIFLNIC